MSWWFSGLWGDRDQDYHWNAYDWEHERENRTEDFVNYLHIGNTRFQLTPSEALTDQKYTRDWRAIPNYRGHTFQLWNDDGTPTPFHLNYHHDEFQSDTERGKIISSVQKARKRGAFLAPPTHAPDPVFTKGFPTNSYEAYGTGPFDARTSRGNSPYQQLDRDMHYYTIDKPDQNEWKLGYPAGRVSARIAPDQQSPETRHEMSAMFNRWHYTNDARNVQSTPRGEAMDPVQAAVLQGDNPKSRLITSGETKLARLVESRATAPAREPASVTLS